MKKIKEYWLVTECNENKLSDAVNKMIDKGWQPFGSISICVDENNVFYAQAVVR